MENAQIPAKEIIRYRAELIKLLAANATKDGTLQQWKAESVVEMADRLTCEAYGADALELIHYGE